MIRSLLFALLLTPGALAESQKLGEVSALLTNTTLKAPEIGTVDEFEAFLDEFDRKLGALEPIDVTKITPEEAQQVGVPDVAGISTALEPILAKGPAFMLMAHRLAASLELHVEGRIFGFKTPEQVRESTEQRLRRLEAAKIDGIDHLEVLESGDGREAEIDEHKLALKQMDKVIAAVEGYLNSPWLQVAGQ